MRGALLTAGSIAGLPAALVGIPGKADAPAASPSNCPNLLLEIRFIRSRAPVA
jgi:hypothetical protein